MHESTKQPQSRVHCQWHWVLWWLSESELFVYEFSHANFWKSNLQTITVYYILVNIYYCSEMCAIFAANHIYFSYATVVCTACLCFSSRFVHPAHVQLLPWGDFDILKMPCSSGELEHWIETCYMYKPSWENRLYVMLMQSIKKKPRYIVVTVQSLCRRSVSSLGSLSYRE